MKKPYEYRYNPKVDMMSRKYSIFSPSDWPMNQVSFHPISGLQLED
ncbi:MAG: hypothetical protein ACQEWI_07105 [Bacillota bacterium]